VGVAIPVVAFAIIGALMWFFRWRRQNRGEVLSPGDGYAPPGESKSVATAQEFTSMDADNAYKRGLQQPNELQGDEDIGGGMPKYSVTSHYVGAELPAESQRVVSEVYTDEASQDRHEMSA
jgi:hypothetical protein